MPVNEMWKRQVGLMCTGLVLVGAGGCTLGEMQPGESLRRITVLCASSSEPSGPVPAGCKPQTWPAEGCFPVLAQIAQGVVIHGSGETI